MAKPIAFVDFDDAEYIGNDEDGVYFAVAKDRRGCWWMSAAVDCNSGHFTDMLVTDDGPYLTEAEAQSAGRSMARHWCENNDVNPDADQDDQTKKK
jgi:hypothetical protein